MKKTGFLGGINVEMDILGIITLKKIEIDSVKNTIIFDTVTFDTNEFRWN